MYFRNNTRNNRFAQVKGNTDQFDYVLYDAYEGNEVIATNCYTDANSFHNEYSPMV